MNTPCRATSHTPSIISVSWVLIFIILGLACVSHVISPRSAGAQRRKMLLSLREATAFALQENLSIQIAGLNPRIREAQVTEEKGIFDVNARAAFTASDSQLLTESSSYRAFPKVGKREVPVLGEAVGFVNGTAVLVPNPGTETLALAGQEDTQNTELSMGISQLTPYGGTYEIEISGRYEDTNRRVFDNLDIPSNKVDFYTTELELKLSQPLLKDFGSTVTQNQILIARNNLTISQEDFRQQVIGVVSSVQQTYWELVFHRQDLEVRHQQLELNQKLLGQIRKQVEVGVLAPIEVLQAETDIARTKERIIVTENAMRDAEDDNGA